MSNSRSSHPPNVPDIEKCPRCGNPILIGDQRCSRCGHNVTTLEDTIRSLSPSYVAFVCFVIGTVLVLAATGMEDTQQIVFLVLGAGIVLAGGAFLGLSYVLMDDKRPRK